MGSSSQRQQQEQEPRQHTLALDPGFTRSSECESQLFSNADQSSAQVVAVSHRPGLHLACCQAVLQHKHTGAAGTAPVLAAAGSPGGLQGAVHNMCSLQASLACSCLLCSHHTTPTLTLLPHSICTLHTLYSMHKFIQRATQPAVTLTRGF